MLQARILRSIFPHARIRHIDVLRARAVPEVHLVLTGDDVRDRGDVWPYFGPVFRDQAALAIDKVRFVGDPVAAVVALRRRRRYRRRQATDAAEATPKLSALSRRRPDAIGVRR